MKRMVKIPSGTWIDIDLIESIEEGLYGEGTEVHMCSGRVHEVDDVTPDKVMEQIKEVWRLTER